jgi:site-specific recombinase XerD
MGAIRKRGRIWYIDYIVAGRRIKKRVGPSKSLAELALKDIEVKIARNDLGFLAKDSDLQKLFQEFLQYSNTNHSPNTVKRYRAILDNFKRYLANLPFITKLSQLDAKIFENYKAFRKDEGAKPKTINIELQTLKSIMTLAIKWGYTNENPAISVEPIKIMRNTEARFLSREEIDKLLAHSNEWLNPIFYAFLQTGMRLQELMNLQWVDIDFVRRKIKIRVKDGWTPKTSEREIPISDGLLKVLMEQKKKAVGSIVFHDGEGEKIQNNKLRKELIKVTKKAGFPDVTKIHSLRHTFASHLVMKGVDLPSIKKLMGHSDIETTMIYAHLAQDHLSDVVSKLDF